jgi:hypothetical protein
MVPGSCPSQGQKTIQNSLAYFVALPVTQKLLNAIDMSFAVQAIFCVTDEVTK